MSEHLRAVHTDSVARYIGKVSEQLAGLAKGAGQRNLSYLLEMIRDEAKRLELQVGSHASKPLD